MTLTVCGLGALTLSTDLKVVFFLWFSIFFTTIGSLMGVSYSSSLLGLFSSSLWGLGDLGGECKWWCGWSSSSF